ncbi:MAG: hypothetical protein IPN70_05170 [Candidatus Moraniibacteriota bacterium]|nr:MAG: hypothetical protein IPN70_05170 [Candidatus Moranbacteria bacterium]
MSYFELDTIQVLRIIEELTKEKAYTDATELQNAIPKKWKLEGCGTGNITNALAHLYREGYIDGMTGEAREVLLEGREIKNQSFFLTPKGREKTKNWFVRNWQIIMGFLVSLATIFTALFTGLMYFSQK